jgi:hypothetical protein
VDNLLERRVRRYIEQLPPAIAGQYGHSATFKMASRLIHGWALSVEDAWPFALEFNQRCMPPWTERELRRKIEQAAIKPDERPRGYLLGAEEGSAPALPTQPIPRLTPVWPKPDFETINAIVRSGPLLADLVELSPVRFHDDQSKAEDIIDVLFPGNPLLCVAKSSETFATRRREVWRGRLSGLPLIVPNPMLAVKGRTQSGRLSEHSQEATGRRVYLCVEFDFAEKGKDGKTDTIWTPLIKDWKADGIATLDASAALILHLRGRLPALATVCFSARRSLHAWFRVLDIEQEKQRAFMNYAVSIGADRATWNRAQLVRIPDGQRPTGERQTSFFLDPGEAVRV